MFSCVDTATGDVAPREFPGFADFPEHARKCCIALEAFGFVDLAGVDVGFASVASRIDEECGAVGIQVCSQAGGVCVVNVLPGEGSVRDIAVFQVGFVSLADIAGGAEQEDHGVYKVTGVLEVVGLGVAVNGFFGVIARLFQNWREYIPVNETLEPSDGRIRSVETPRYSLAVCPEVCADGIPWQCLGRGMDRVGATVDAGVVFFCVWVVRGFF